MTFTQYIFHYKADFMINILLFSGNYKEKMKKFGIDEPLFLCACVCCTLKHSFAR